MRKLFAYAIKKHLPALFVLDDDSILHKNFEEEALRLLANPVCGMSMQGTAGGVMLFGSSIWRNGTWPQTGKWAAGWNLVEQDMINTSRSTGSPALCYTANDAMLGSYAVLYHHHVFTEMIHLIDQHWGVLPFDRLFPFISRKGYPVRAAYPHLVLQDIRHVSRVDNNRRNDRYQQDLAFRATVHRWNLSNFSYEE